MINTFSHYRSYIVQLYDDAIQGAIHIDDFYKKWPYDIEKSYLTEFIYDDLEDGIAHFPGKIFSGKKDFKAWKKSEACERLMRNREAIKSEKIPEALLQKNGVIEN